jgi:hypothetical protein
MKMKSFSRLLLLVLGFIAFTILTFEASWKYFESRREVKASEANAKFFPIVAILPERAEIITIESLPDFKAKNPNYSFLVPNEKESLINEQLEKFQTEQYRKGIPHIKVEQISKDKQKIELEIQSDGFIFSKYKASDKEVEPMSYKAAGPAFIFFPCGLTFVIVFAGFFLLRFAIWIIKRRKTHL